KSSAPGNATASGAAPERNGSPGAGMPDTRSGAGADAALCAREGREKDGSYLPRLACGDGFEDPERGPRGVDQRLERDGEPRTAQGRVAESRELGVETLVHSGGLVPLAPSAPREGRDREILAAGDAPGAEDLDDFLGLGRIAVGEVVERR